MKAKIEERKIKKKERDEGIAAVAGVRRVIRKDRVVEQLVDDQLIVHSRITMYDYADRQINHYNHGSNLSPNTTSPADIVRAAVGFLEVWLRMRLS